MKNQGLGLDLSAKAYIQIVIPKFDGIFGKEPKPIKTLIEECQQVKIGYLKELAIILRYS
jgi:hypothetical protein